MTILGDIAVSNKKTVLIYTSISLMQSEYLIPLIIEIERVANEGFCWFSPWVLGLPSFSLWPIYRLLPKIPLYSAI